MGRGCRRTVHKSFSQLFVFGGTSGSELVTVLSEMNVPFPDIGKRHDGRVCTILVILIQVLAAFGGGYSSRTNYPAFSVQTADGGPGVGADAGREFLELEPGAGLGGASRADGDLEGDAFA